MRGKFVKHSGDFDVCEGCGGFGLIRKEGYQSMCAYELYWFDKTEKAHFIAILHEKRENLLRITRESVLDLGRKVMGDNADVSDIYFIQVEVS